LAELLDVVLETAADGLSAILMPTAKVMATASLIVVVPILLLTLGGVETVSVFSEIWR
jgi:hypothetical protein